MPPPTADRWTFVMVTPDAMVGGYLDLVLERARDSQFVVRACRLLGLDYERLGRMYSHSDRPARYGGQRIELPPWVMEPLYLIAPAAILVLERSEGEACASMLRCKGAARPESAAPGTIRASGENYVFNLVHCPDDEPSAAIELSYLVGPTDAAGLQAIAADGRPEMDSLVGVDQLRLCLPAFSGWEALSFPSVASRVRCRVVQKLASRALADGALQAPLQAAATALRRERALLAAAPSPAERMAIGQASSALIHQHLTRATGAASDDALQAGLVALAALYDLDGARDVAAIRALARSGVYLSELEKIVLDTQAYTLWRDPAV